MKYLRYAHEACRPLLAEIHSRVYRWVVGRLASPRHAGRRRFNTRALLVFGAVVLTLLAESVMLWFLAYMIDLCISLMELWTELAAKHLEITLDTTP